MLIGKIDYENKNDITMDGILHRRKKIYIYIYFRYGEKRTDQKKSFFFGRGGLIY